MTTDSDYVKRLDSNVRPQDDFFDYVNDKWLQAHPIPASETRWGTFNVLHDESRQHMHDIYEGLQDKKDVAKGSLEQQARDFYHTGMHFDDYEANHLALIKRYFEKIDTVSQPHDISKLLGELHTLSVDIAWRVIVDADDKDSSRHILRLTQSHLTLPDRDYYLEDNEKMHDIRTKYKQHAQKVYHHFPALGEGEETFWQTLWNFELASAKVLRSQIELRDIENNYHSVSFQQLTADYPNIDWQLYARALGWDTSSHISVDQPEYLAFINDQITTLPLDQWKLYLKWRFLMEYYGKISSRFADLRFEFFGKVLSGATEIMPLWKRVVGQLDNALGEGVGRLYAKKHFPKESKQQVLALVEDIRAAYKERIEQLDWMEEDTKTTALKKLANIKVLIGYPDEWRDFSGLTITADSHLENVIAAEKFNSAYWLDRLLQPTSRDDWFMNPQTVNAYNDPNRLVICFPAAILQPPFFDATANDAANMGGIGAVIGHEFTHGFDDQGYQFDEYGNVRAWQSEKERQAFKQRAKLIIQQADEFEVIPGVHLKGELVIGESIADLGGLELAYHALQKKMPHLDEEVAEGINAQQLFFIAFAAGECGATRPERQRELAVRDPHPAERFRVNATVSHCDGFYKAYDVQARDALYRPAERRAKIW